MKKLLSRRSTWCALALASLIHGLTSSGAQAAEISGVVLPEGTRVGQQALVLNGAGMRALAVFKVYVIGMYLPQRAATVPAVLDMPGAKRLQLVLMRDIDGEDFGRALSRGMTENLTTQELAALQSRVDQLRQAMMQLGETRKGSQVLLDYSPDTGTHITVNGRVLLSDIPGDDFYRALLKVWLGPRPAGEYLKRELLGQSS